MASFISAYSFTSFGRKGFAIELGLGRAWCRAPSMGARGRQLSGDTLGKAPASGKNDGKDIWQRLVVASSADGPSTGKPDTV